MRFLGGSGGKYRGSQKIFLRTPSGGGRKARKASTAKIFHKIRHIFTKSGTFFTESRGVEGSGLVKVNFTLRFRGGGTLTYVAKMKNQKLMLMVGGWLAG